MSATSSGPERQQMRAAQLLRNRTIWIMPLVLAAVLVALISVIYIGSVIDPAGHLHGLPVMVVDEDAGGSADGHQLNVGRQLVGALELSSGVTSRPVTPVPPVEITTSIAGSAIHALSCAMISSFSSRTMRRAAIRWPAVVARSARVLPERS